MAGSRSVCAVFAIRSGAIRSGALSRGSGSSLGSDPFVPKGLEEARLEAAWVRREPPTCSENGERDERTCARTHALQPFQKCSPRRRGHGSRPEALWESKGLGNLPTVKAAELQWDRATGAPVRSGRTKKIQVTCFTPNRVK